jgi:glucose/arabinose dehydrogenase
VLTIPEEVVVDGGETEEATDTAPTVDTANELTTDDDDRKWTTYSYELLELATVDFPTALVSRSGGDDLWLTERPGRVRQIQRRTSLDGEEQGFKLLNTVVLDITDQVSTEGEGGLLGLAFSTDGRFLYVSYTNQRGNSVIAEYEMDSISAVVASERILLEVEQPFANHNGGDIAIGPDGFLYVALGDGGSSGDPLQNGQNPTTALGSILRIDPLAVAGERPYAVPADNPFLGDEDGLDEVWLYGARNPWRFSFDRITGDLWIADVGQNQIEEINWLPAAAGPAGRGVNLGWRAFEGTDVFDQAAADTIGDVVDPVYTYPHDNGRCSVTGGYVYRGTTLRELTGVYLFGDFCSGELIGLQPQDGNTILVAELLTSRPAFSLASFGQDSNGELYVLQGTGEVAMLVRPGVGPDTRVLGPNESFRGGVLDDAVEPANGPDVPRTTTTTAADE